MAVKDRTVLLLQGPPSSFWRELGEGFSTAGAALLKVNFCLGDAVYWGRKPALTYKGNRSDWPGYLTDLIERHGITDILYFGDRMPYHAAAAQCAQRLGIRCYAVEFGYLRPGWITLERGGMGAHSHFPDDGDRLSALARDLPAVDGTRRYAHAFAVEAFNEVAFNLLTSVGRLHYRQYDPDRFYAPWPEYLSTLLRTQRRRRHKATADGVLRQAADRAWPYALHALQLQSDWQIRANSPYRDQREVLDLVIASLARDAHEDMRLIVKLHPMDVGMIDWGAETSAIARRHGVQDRVHFIDGGDLDALMAHAIAVFVVNSTVGLHALRAGRPVRTFGVAVYDMAGLTDQRDLAEMWTSPSPPDPALVDALVRTLAATIQLRGSFYARGGRGVAVGEIVRRVLGDLVNEVGAFVDPPPRLAAARARGVTC